jgi:spore coat polysaccharide biosynthesis protein SpsF (cytidylyltransferase family)
MKVKFQDYYGQYIDINNETASGNVRLRVRTTKNLNDIHSVKEEDCEIETDISLDENQLTILYGSIKSMLEKMG